MKAFAAVFWREVRERRLLLVGGLALGLLPLAVPLLPVPLAVRAPEEVREAAALALFWLGGLAFAVVMGASVLGGDLAERRLGFYFSRPLAAGTIWAAKLAAALVLVLIAGALILLPTVLAGQGLPRAERLWAGSLWDSLVPELNLEFWVWPLLVLVLIGLAHATRTFVLARSPWRLFDVVALVLAAAAVRWIWGRLLGGWALGALTIATRFLEVALVLGLLLAWALQIVCGRTALRRGHRILSLTFWGVLLGAVALAGAYSGWVLGATPEDLERISFVEPVPSGDWVILAGPARGRAGYHPSFLYRVGDGDFFRLPAGDPPLAETLGRALPGFTAAGTRAYWFEPLGHLSDSSLVLTRIALEGGAGRELRLSVPLRSGGGTVALSADGSRLAERVGRLLTVEDLDRRLLLASLRLPAEAAKSELRFEADPDRLLLLDGDCAPDCRLIVRRLEVSSGELKEVLHVQGWITWTLDAARSRLLLSDRDREAGSRYRLRLADLDTGAVAEIGPPESERGWLGHFLADGRILLQSAGDAAFWTSPSHQWIARSRLWLADEQGALLRPLEVGTGSLRVGGQPAADRLLVALAPRPTHAIVSLGNETAYLVDLEGGPVRTVGHGLLPVAGPEVGPASVGSRLLRGAEGELMLLDPDTLELSRILPPP